MSALADLVELVAGRKSRFFVMALSEYWKSIIANTVPILVGGGLVVGGFDYLTKDRGHDIEMVKIGVQILRVDPNKNPEIGDAGREWAMRLINRYSGESLTVSEMDQLRTSPIVDWYNDNTPNSVLYGAGYKRITPSKATAQFIWENDKELVDQIAAHNLQCEKDASCLE
ncbi:MAG: hypothetical protein K5905_00185 [Roseibium sp.]|uniref:hypothetical protein n=1 Tax=Roseibium sp. TaxID=1936156 RepID=UPI00263144E6|nr:hypothetical protein [Roseibium sp.]MCV0423867.1 hypothetical protein [Roseibium sp.]